MKHLAFVLLSFENLLSYIQLQQGSREVWIPSDLVTNIISRWYKKIKY
jgi:hypothetical protein